MNRSPEVAIIGAGPYGLSVGAHLRSRGVEFRIFGRPMNTWLTQMPRGMLLKSDGFASSLSAPDERFTLRDYCRRHDLPYADEGRPVPLETFCKYGLAFQRELVPQLEDRAVVSLDRAGKGFILQLDDGQIVTPSRVVIAVGISSFQNVPEQLSHLPLDQLSHSSRHRDLDSFRGRDVTVIGGGSSALDLAGLLNAAGAKVRLLCRRQAVVFHQSPGSRPRSLWQSLRHPRSGIGHSLRSSLFAAAPNLFHFLPQQLRLRIVREHLGPAGGWFAREMVIGKVPMLMGCSVRAAEIKDGRVLLKVESVDGAASEVITDHVIAATGYRADLRRLTFLAPELSAQLRSVEHVPVLSRNFESSTEGLYFVGAISANSFGPVVRFAFGARFTAVRLTGHLSGFSRRSMERQDFILAR